MRRVLNPLALTCLAAATLAFGLAAPVQAQVVVYPSAPVVVQRPVVTYYNPPVVTYRGYAPRVSYYQAPVVTTYAPAPVVTSYAAPAYYPSPIVTTSYAAPIVTTTPGLYTTYTYRNGLGIFRPRYVNQTYYTPVR